MKRVVAAVVAMLFLFVLSLTAKSAVLYLLAVATGTGALALYRHELTRARKGPALRRRPTQREASQREE